MARSDLVLSLVRAATRGDAGLLQRSVEALAAEERAKQHNVLADRLEEQLRSVEGRSLSGATMADERSQKLLHEITPTQRLEDLILPEVVHTACAELIEEHHRADLLRSYGLEPRSRVLLVGPPGNGKTSLAEALAESLMVPLFVIRYEGVIGSYLGETASRLATLFQYVRSRRCVLFFDEFDTLGKERGDTHETGEIKRVVSSLLLQIDSLPTSVVVVTATNHAELLDRAVWRRFQLRLRLPRPGRDQIAKWFERFEGRTGHRLGVPHAQLAERLVGLSFAEVEQFGLDVRRRVVLAQPSADIRRIINERLRQYDLRTSARPSRKKPPRA